jgi:hypothetical protein
VGRGAVSGVRIIGVSIDLGVRGASIGPGGDRGASIGLGGHGATGSIDPGDVGVGTAIGNIDYLTQQAEESAEPKGSRAFLPRHVPPLLATAPRTGSGTAQAQTDDRTTRAHNFDRLRFGYFAGLGRRRS